MPCVLSKSPGPTPGELQQLRRIIGSAGNQHFLARPRNAQIAVLLVLHRLRTLALEQDALRQRRRFDMQIAAVFRRPQIGERAGRPAAAPRRGLEEARTFLRLAVEIRIEGNAGLDRRFDEGLRQRVIMTPVRHRQRAAGAVIIVGAALLVLRLLEIGQHVVITPADIAALAPAVVILMLAAHVKQAVDRARSAQYFSARLEDLASAQAGLRLGLIHPVDGFFLEQLAVADRHVNPDVGVLWARFQQQHRMLAVGREPVGQHAPGRAGADDDVIEFGGCSRPVIVHGLPRSPRDRQRPPQLSSCTWWAMLWDRGKGRQP